MNKETPFVLSHGNKRDTQGILEIWWQWNWKKSFYSSKRAIAIGNVDIKKIIKQKYKKLMLRFFPGYIDDKKVRTLCI